jgi:uncharacterized protein
MSIGVNQIPEVLNEYNVYDDDTNVLIGISDSVTLAAMQLMTATISGAGIGGEYSAPVVGHWQSVQQEIPFRTLYKSVLQYMDHTKVAKFSLRGALQVTDKDTGTTSMVPIRYVVRGKTTEVNPGSAKPGDAMGASIKMEVLYMLLEIDGTKIIEADKLNDVFSVNGTDLMDEVRSMC